MRRFQLLALACCTATLAACPGPDTDDEDTMMGDTTAMGAPMPAPAGATISLADVAGRWNMHNVPETGDTTPTRFVLNATADRTGWTFAFPGREPIQMRVIDVSGDSIVTEAGPYESARRPGVQVSTQSVFRMRGDQLTGTTVARYQTTGADSVLRLRGEGTRAP